MKIVSKSDNINTKIGKILQNIRQKKGIKQEELAKNLGIKRPTLSLYESGKANFSIEFLLLLSKELNISLLDLIPDEFKNTLDQAKPSENFNLENDVEFALELAIRHYLLYKKVKKNELQVVVPKIIRYIANLAANK